MTSFRSLQDSIKKQRESLSQLLNHPLHELAAQCRDIWGDREQLDRTLEHALNKIPNAKFLYVLDTNGIQLSDNISTEGRVLKDFGRDRSQRPYMRQAVPSTGFLLSEAYISLRERRPSLTAIQIVHNDTGKVLGFVGADFDLRNLPLTAEMYEEPNSWRQIKGDPAIRGTVFHQTRSESLLDKKLTEVIGVMEELIVDHGVFQCTLHFSSSRATVWLYNNPYTYRLLDVEALTDPDICLAYPILPYPEDAVIPRDKIRPILDTFGQLRVMDDMFYLRSSSINIFNGIISLTFSCDGSHYLAYDEFLDKRLDFWVGTAVN
ncbi:MAG: hypothetical protein HUJ29_11690 [Gammaproteobacteria bacterium]|nr:hypothetical protein [Gammaproteobacteria bacterium]